MAKLHTPFTFSGTLASVTAYTRKDLDTPILRTKGGPTKEQIENDDAFELKRYNISEFIGRSRTGKWVKQTLMPLKLLADHNLGASLNPILKPIQEADTVSQLGKRHVELSKNPRLLEGFEVNRRTHLDSVARNPVSCTLSKETLSGQVVIGVLLPRVKFTPQVPLPYYRLVATLGPAPDLFFPPRRLPPIGRLPVYQPAGGIHRLVSCGQWFSGPNPGAQPAAGTSRLFVQPGAVAGHFVWKDGSQGLGGSG